YQRDRNQDHHTGSSELQRPLGDPGTEPISQPDRDPGHGPQRERGGDEDDDRRLIPRLQGRRGQLREVAPLGDEDDRKRGRERVSMAPLLALEFVLVIGLPALHEVLPNEEGGHHEEQDAGADPDWFAGKQAE